MSKSFSSALSVVGGILLYFFFAQNAVFGQTANSEWTDVSLSGTDTFDIEAEYRYKISSASSFWLYPKEISARSLVSNESYFGQIFYVNADTKTSYQYNGNFLDTVVQIQKRILPPWTDVSLTGTDLFDPTFEYRFKMTVPGRPGVPAGDFWYYAKQAGTQSLVMDNGYGEITFVSAANKTAYLSQGTPTGITISQMQRRARTWTDVPLNNTETYDVSCEYRFKMNYPSSPQWRPGVPAGDFWHYPERSSPQSLMANANGGYQTFSVFANNKAVFDFNGVNNNAVLQMQKSCNTPLFAAPVCGNPSAQVNFVPYTGIPAADQNSSTNAWDSITLGNKAVISGGTFFDITDGTNPIDDGTIVSTGLQNFAVSRHNGYIEFLALGRRLSTYYGYYQGTIKFQNVQVDRVESGLTTATWADIGLEAVEGDTVTKVSDTEVSFKLAFANQGDGFRVYLKNPAPTPCTCPAGQEKKPDPKSPVCIVRARVDGVQDTIVTLTGYNHLVGNCTVAGIVPQAPQTPSPDLVVTAGQQRVGWTQSSPWTFQLDPLLTCPAGTTKTACIFTYGAGPLGEITCGCYPNGYTTKTFTNPTVQGRPVYSRDGSPAQFCREQGYTERALVKNVENFVGAGSLWNGQSWEINQNLEIIKEVECSNEPNTVCQNFYEPRVHGKPVFARNASPAQFCREQGYAKSATVNKEYSYEGNGSLWNGSVWEINLNLAAIREVNCCKLEDKPSDICVASGCAEGQYWCQSENACKPAGQTCGAVTCNNNNTCEAGESCNCGDCTNGGTDDADKCGLSGGAQMVCTKDVKNTTTTVAGSTQKWIAYTYPGLASSYIYLTQLPAPSYTVNGKTFIVYDPVRIIKGMSKATFLADPATAIKNAPVIPLGAARDKRVTFNLAQLQAETPTVQSTVIDGLSSSVNRLKYLCTQSMVNAPECDSNSAGSWVPSFGYSANGSIYVSASGGSTNVSYVEGEKIGIFDASVDATCQPYTTSSLQYIPNTDPRTQGWLNINGIGTAQNDAGKLVWQVNDGGNDTGDNAVVYKKFSTTQLGDFFTRGGKYSVELKNISASAPTSGAAYLLASYLEIARGANTTKGARRFTFVFGLDADKTPTIIGLTSNGTTYTTPSNSTYKYRVDGGANKYNTYDMVYDPATDTVDMFVNGVERISNFPGNTVVPGYATAIRDTAAIIFGSGTSPGVANTNYGNIAVSIKNNCPGSSIQVGACCPAGSQWDSSQGKCVLPGVPGCAEGEYYCHTELKCKAAGATCGTVTCNNNNVCDTNESCDCADCNEKVDHCGLSSTGEQMICTKDTAPTCYTDKFPYCLSACLDGYTRNATGQCVLDTSNLVPPACTVRSIDGTTTAIATCQSNEILTGGGCTNTMGGAYFLGGFPIRQGESWTTYTPTYDPGYWHSLEYPAAPVGPLTASGNGYACATGYSATYVRASAVCCQNTSMDTTVTRTGTIGDSKSLVQCNAGEVRVGGGCRYISGGSYFVAGYPLGAGETYSGLTATQDGFVCVGGVGTMIEARAVCKPAKTGETVKVVKGPVNGVATCDDGYTVTGGGCESIGGAYYYIGNVIKAGETNAYTALTPTNDGYVCASGASGTNSQPYAICVSPSKPSTTTTPSIGSQDFTYPVKIDGYVKNDTASATKFCTEKGFTSAMIISSDSSGAKKMGWNGTAWVADNSGGSYIKLLTCFGGTPQNYTCKEYTGNIQTHGGYLSIQPQSTTQFCKEAGYDFPQLMAQYSTSSSCRLWNGTSWYEDVACVAASGLQCCQNPSPTTNQCITPKMKVNFTRTENAPNSIILGSGTVLTNNPSFDLTSNGVATLDSTLLDNTTHFSVRRQNGYVEFMARNPTATNAYYTGTITLENATVDRVEGGLLTYSDPGYGLEGVDGDSATKTNSTVVNFNLAFTYPGDGFRIYYNMASSSVLCSGIGSISEPQPGACCPPGSAWNSTENRCIPTTCGEGQFYCAAQKKCLAGGQTCDTVVCNNDGVCSGEESCQCSDCVNGGGDDKDKCSIVGGVQAICSDDNPSDGKPGACCVPPKKWDSTTNTCVECSNTQAPSELKAGVDQPYITCTGNGDTTKTHFRYRITPAMGQNGVTPASTATNNNFKIQKLLAKAVNGACPTDPSTYVPNLTGVVANDEVCVRLVYNNATTGAISNALITDSVPTGFTRIDNSTKNCLTPTGSSELCSDATGMGGAIGNNGWSGNNFSLTPHAGFYAIPKTQTTPAVMEMGRVPFLKMTHCNWFQSGVGGLDSIFLNYFYTSTSGTDGIVTTDAYCNLNPINGYILGGGNGDHNRSLLGQKYYHYNYCNYNQYSSGNSKILINGTITSNSTTNPLTSTESCKADVDHVMTPTPTYHDMLGQRYLYHSVCRYVQTAPSKTWDVYYRSNVIFGNTTPAANCPDNLTGYTMTDPGIVPIDLLDATNGKGYIQYKVRATSTPNNVLFPAVNLSGAINGNTANTDSSTSTASVNPGATGGVMDVSSIFTSDIFPVGTQVLHPTMTLGDYTVECFYGNASGVDTSTTAAPHSCVKTMSVKSDAQGCSRVYPYKENTLSDEMISSNAFDASFRCGSRKPVLGTVTNPYMFRVGTQAASYLSFDALISELFNGLTIGPVSIQTQNYAFNTGNTDVTCATKVGGGYSTNTACQLRTCVGGACNVPQTFSVVHSDDLICTTEETSKYNIGCNPAAPDSVRNQCIQWFRDAVNAGSRTVPNGVEFNVSFVFNGDAPTNVKCIKYVAGQMPGGLNLSDNVVCSADLKNGERYQIYAADTNGRIDALQTTAKTVERDSEKPSMADIKYYTDESLTTEVLPTNWYNKPVIALAVCSDTPLNEATSCACAQRVDVANTTDADAWSLGVPNSLIGADLMRYTRTITETLTGTQKVQVIDTAGNTSSPKNIAVSLDTQVPLVTPSESGTGATKTITLTASDTGSKIWKTTTAPSGATNSNGIIYRVGLKSDMANLAFNAECNTTATYASVTETQATSFASQAVATIPNINTATQVVAYCVRDNAGNTTRGMYPVVTDACFSASNMSTIPNLDTYKALLKTRLTATGTDNQKYGYSFSENTADANCFRGILGTNITTLMANQLKPRTSTTLSNWDRDRAELSTSTTLSNGYYYYVYPTSNTLNIVTSPSGGAPVKSVVVEGGDIRIKTDINYSGAGKTLLLIARKNSNGQGGNIIIDTNVRNIDAILIADGGALRSSDATLPGERLTINGRVYSYNTRGGSLAISGTDFIDATTPKKFTNSSLVSASSLNDARIQDLERFRPIFADGNKTCSLTVNYTTFTTVNLPALLKRPNTFTGGSCGF